MSWQNLIKESENMAMFLKNTFTKPVANLVRLALKKGYNTPKVDITKCPTMDRVMKGNTLKETKDADETAAKQQMLMLNAVATLVHILENA